MTKETEINARLWLLVVFSILIFLFELLNLTGDDSWSVEGASSDNIEDDSGNDNEAAFDGVLLDENWKQSAKGKLHHGNAACAENHKLPYWSIDLYF